MTASITYIGPENVSRDTVQTLEILLEEARRGELIGLAYSAMYRPRDFTVNATGEVKRSPILASGMVSRLQNYIYTLPGNRPRKPR